MKKILTRSFLIFFFIILFLILYGVYLFFDAGEVSDGYPIPGYGISYSAILVINIQEGTTGEVSFIDPYKQKSAELIKNVNTIITFADSLRIPVLYIKQETDNWLINLISDNVLEKDNYGSKLDSRLKKISNHIFPKQKMDAFSNPDLDKFLIDHCITNLFIIGLDAAFSVNLTVFAANNRNYTIYIIDDAVLSIIPSLKYEMMQEFMSLGMNVIKLDESKDIIYKSQTLFYE
jgi:nicotinamidase-related amidase